LLLSFRLFSSKFVLSFKNPTTVEGSMKMKGFVCFVMSPFEQLYNLYNLMQILVTC